MELLETKKAVAIAESFEVSKQFWSFLVNNNLVGFPRVIYKKHSAHEFCMGR